MKRVAIFGNAGGGKSTLARELAAITGLPLYVIDKIRFPTGVAEMPREEYLKLHADLLDRDEWIIDGFENVNAAWERFEAADTLIHVDLSLVVHAWWVTKRLVNGLFVAPAGWPEGASVIESSISSYRVLWPCHKHLTPSYRSYMLEVAKRKQTFHLRSKGEMQQFLQALKNELSSAQPM
jgi:adenylate kinase family enzyme